MCVYTHACEFISLMSETECATNCNLKLNVLMEVYSCVKLC